MLIAAVLCLCAAVATAGLGVWLLSQPKSGDYVRQILRGVAPIQLAAAVMLADHALYGYGESAGLFRGETLPSVVDVAGRLSQEPA